MRRDQGVRWLAPTNGVVSGWLGIGIGLLAATLAATDGAWSVVVIGLTVIAFSVLVLLRPRVGVTAEHLILRGIFSTVVIPLPLIDTVRVRQVFAVWVEDKRYVNPSIGRKFRDVRPRPGQGEVPDTHVDHLVEVVTSQITNARAVGPSSDRVRRRWDYPEIVGAVVAVGALVAVAVR